MLDSIFPRQIPIFLENSAASIDYKSHKSSPINIGHKILKVEKPCYHDVLKTMTFFLNPYRRWLLYSTKTKVIYKSNRSARKLMAQFSLSSWSPQQEPHSFMTVMRLWYRVVECSVWAKRFKHLAKTMLSVWHFISQSGTTTFRLPGQAVGRTQCSKIRKKSWTANFALHTPLQVHLENQTKKCWF